MIIEYDYKIMILVPKTSICPSLMIKINSKMATYKKTSFYPTVVLFPVDIAACYVSLLYVLRNNTTSFSLLRIYVDLYSFT